MTARERYLFDLQGFLVIPGLLSSSEVECLNEAADANSDKIQDTGAAADSPTLAGGPRRQYTDLLTWDKPWCDPFRELLAHACVAPYLDELLGRGWHVDTEPIYFHYGKGAGGLKLHGGDRTSTPGRTTSSRPGRCGTGSWWSSSPCWTRSKATAASAAFRKPEGELRTPAFHHDMGARPGPAPQPGLRAGDVLIFSEQLTHGTLPWTAGHERRALHYRLAPKCVQYGPGLHSISLPPWADELTDAQRATLEHACYYGRPLIQSDGSVRRPLVDVQDAPFRYLALPPEVTDQMPDVDPVADPASAFQGGFRVVPLHDGA